MKTSHQTSVSIPIPGRLNILIAMSSFAFALFCLKMASISQSWWQILIWAIAFSYINNTIFSLLHEAVHRILHPNRKINDFFGMLCASFFPTGFIFQRAFHLGHHRRNRTDVEMFDMYYPTDNKSLKFIQLYTVLLGFYWTSAPLGGLLYILSPRILNMSLFRSKHKNLKPMSMDAMLSGLERINPLRARLELLWTLIFQISIFFALHLTWQSWLICYWCFAINWGSIQYADHAWSKRDIRNGAWNLKVNPIVRILFLNYHHHLAHHQHPYVSWIHLKKFVEHESEQPEHFKIWLKMFKGPTLTTEASPERLSVAFEKIIYDGPEKL